MELTLLLDLEAQCLSRHSFRLPEPHTWSVLVPMRREGLHLFSGVVLVVLVVPETVSGLARFSTTLLVALAVGDVVVGGDHLLKPRHIS